MYWSSISEPLSSLISLCKESKITELEKNGNILDLFFHRLKNPDKIHCWVVGNSGIGKTTFLNTLSFLSKDNWDFQEYSLESLDISFSRTIAWEEAEMVVFVTDCADGFTHLEKKAFELLVQQLPFSNLLIVLNKIDLFPEKEDRDRARRRIQYYLQQFDRPFPILLYSGKEVELSQKGVLKSENKEMPDCSWTEEDIRDFFKNMEKTRELYLRNVLLQSMLKTLKKMDAQRDAKYPSGFLQQILKDDKKKQQETDTSRFCQDAMEQIKDDFFLSKKRFANQVNEETEKILRLLQKHKQATGLSLPFHTIKRNIEDAFDKLREELKKKVLDHFQTVSTLTQKEIRHPDYAVELEKAIPFWNHPEPKSSHRLVLKTVLCDFFILASIFVFLCFFDTIVSVWGLRHSIGIAVITLIGAAMVAWGITQNCLDKRKSETVHTLDEWKDSISGIQDKIRAEVENFFDIRLGEALKEIEIHCAHPLPMKIESSQNVEKKAIELAPEWENRLSFQILELQQKIETILRQSTI